MKNANFSKRGFTLIEVLVASLLMGMLVVILTMVFNQSSLAWSVGKASVASLDKVRNNLGKGQRQADNALAHVSAMSGNKTICMVVSPWKFSGNQLNQEIRKRAIERISDSVFNESQLAQTDPKGWQLYNVGSSASTDSQTSYLVGVLSYGPDGQRDTEDDITSWPEDIQ